MTNIAMNSHFNFQQELMISTRRGGELSAVGKRGSHITRYKTIDAMKADHLASIKADKQMYDLSHLSHS
jgi:hypothetical protein